MELGLRVVRGPDWKWGQQDGGNGHVGTVVEIGQFNSSSIPQKTVVVQWDSGSRSNYRVGYQGSYDLRVFDNAPAGAYHPRILCDECGCEGIVGIRWQCSNCIDFDLCTPCYMKGAHDLNHTFIRIESIYHLGSEMPKRALNNTERLQARGIFKGAKVVRGYDWEWGPQDGGEGTVGEVIDIRGWDKSSGRSVAAVVWPKSSNVYRVGHKGRVDLKTVVDALGGYYYRDHLPILGQNFFVSGPVEALIGAAAAPVPPQIIYKSQQQQSSSSSSSVGAMSQSNNDTFEVGDLVKVAVSSIDELKSLQKTHGGWNPKMAQFIGKIGIVHRLTDNRDIRVQFGDYRDRWTFNPKALEKERTLFVGDDVRVIDDEQQMKALQPFHGEYVPEMRNILGQIGKVMKIYSDGDIRVKFEDRTYTLNPKCIFNLSGMERHKAYRGIRTPCWNECMGELEQLLINKSSNFNCSTTKNTTSPLFHTETKITQGKDSSNAIHVNSNSSNNNNSNSNISNNNNSSNSNSNSNNNNNNNNNSCNNNNNTNDNNNPASSKSGSSSASDSSSNLLDTMVGSEENGACWICGLYANIVLDPCRHRVCCSQCVGRLEKCLKCKQNFDFAEQKMIIYKKRVNPSRVYGRGSATTSIATSSSTSSPSTSTSAPSSSSSSSSYLSAPLLSSKSPTSTSSSSSASLLKNNLNIKSIKSSDNDLNIEDPIQRVRYLEQKIMEIEEANTCGICLESTKNVIFLCGHGACAICANTLLICHMCRKPITKKINVY